MKSILKKDEEKEDKNTAHVRKLQWDEENLRVSEEQKTAMMKITEPDTPYIHYNMNEDPEVMAEIGGFDLGGMSSDSSVTESLSSVSKDSLKEWDTSEEEGSDAFERMRRQHYNMTGSLKKGKQLLGEIADEEMEMTDEDIE